MEKLLSAFEERAINELALSLVDYDTDRSALPQRARDVAALIGCTTDELFCCMHVALTGIMSMTRTTDFYGLPMIDIAAAREAQKGGCRFGRLLVKLPERLADG